MSENLLKNDDDDDCWLDDDFAPEVKLLAKVMRRVRKDACGKLGGIPGSTSAIKRKQLIKNARKWILSNSQELMSFSWICEALNLPEDEIRERMKKEMANCSKGD